MFDTEKFICEIELRPAIWDVRSKLYSNKTEKTKAWEEICSSFIDNFEALEKDEKNKEAIALQKKWKNIRDCYRRECAKKKTEKSGSGATAVRKEYIFFSQLSFLSANNDIKPSQSNDDMEEEEDFEKGRCDARKDLPKPSAKKKRASAEDSLIIALSAKIKKQLDEPKDDADRNFLMSLLPHLKSVPDSSKLDCQVVKRYKAPSITHPYQVPYPINYQASQSFHGHGNFGVQSAQSGEFATPAVSPVGSASVDSNDTILEELF